MHTPISLTKSRLVCSVISHLPMVILRSVQNISWHHAWSPLAGGQLFEPRMQLYMKTTQMAEQQVSFSAVAIAWLLAHPAR